MKIVFLVCACISIAAVVLICIFMFANGMPAIQEIGPIKFLFGTEWKPGQGIFGIGPMIIGSILIFNMLEGARSCSIICCSFPLCSAPRGFIFCPPR